MQGIITLSYVNDVQRLLLAIKTAKRSYLPSNAVNYTNVLYLLELHLRFPEGLKTSYLITVTEKSKYLSKYNTLCRFVKLGFMERLPGRKGFVFSDKGKAFIRDIELELVRLRGLK